MARPFGASTLWAGGPPQQHIEGGVRTGAVYDQWGDLVHGDMSYGDAQDSGMLGAYRTMRGGPLVMGQKASSMFSSPMRAMPIAQQMPIPAPATNLVQFPQARESGGPVRSAARQVRPYIVNEDGEEMYVPEGGPPHIIRGGEQVFLPPQDGKIIPHKKASRLAKELGMAPPKHAEDGAPNVKGINNTPVYSDPHFRRVQGGALWGTKSLLPPSSGLAAFYNMNPQSAPGAATRHSWGNAPGVGEAGYGSYPTALSQLRRDPQFTGPMQPGSTENLTDAGFGTKIVNGMEVPLTQEEVEGMQADARRDSAIADIRKQGGIASVGSPAATQPSGDELSFQPVMQIENPERTPEQDAFIESSKYRPAASFFPYHKSEGPVSNEPSPLRRAIAAAEATRDAQSALLKPIRSAEDERTRKNLALRSLLRRQSQEKPTRPIGRAARAVGSGILGAFDAASSALAWPFSSEPQ